LILFEIPWGWFADRFGYKKTIIISIALSGLSGCDIALLYSSTDGEKSGKTFGRYNAFSTGGFLIASFLMSFYNKYIY
jgi:MFS family permease